MGFQFTVGDLEIEKLLEDNDFMHNYRLGHTLLAESWGWDLGKGKVIVKHAPKQTWSRNGTRLYKVGLSSIVFRQFDIYEKWKSFALYLKKRGYKLDFKKTNVFEVWEKEKKQVDIKMKKDEKIKLEKKKELKEKMNTNPKEET